MGKIPIIIAKFLSLPDKDGFTIHDKFAFLVKSLDGDSYYLCERLPEEGLITEELGDKVYDAITENITYKDIFTWYRNWGVVD